MRVIVPKRRAASRRVGLVVAALVAAGRRPEPLALPAGRRLAVLRDLGAVSSRLCVISPRLASAVVTLWCPGAAAVVSRKTSAARRRSKAA